MEAVLGRVALAMPALKPARIVPFMKRQLVEAMPLFVILAMLLGLWQLLLDHPGAALPTPSKVWAQNSELILHPFYDRGGLDKGLGLHLGASLLRVAMASAWRPFLGVALGLLVGTSDVAMRGSTRSFRYCVPCRLWPGCRCRWQRSAMPSRARFS